MAADTVQPDGFVDFYVHRGGEVHQECYYLEADNGTEFQAAWREKVRALVAFADGPYRKTFESEPITISVIATPGPKRAEQLRAWTETELSALGRQADAALFAFVGADPARIPASTLLLTSLWTMPFHPEPFPLITDLSGGDG
jgi:hypothetical protein